VPRRPVTHDESPSAVRDALDLKGPLPERGAEPGPLLEATAQLLFDHSLFNGHPRALKVWLALRHVGAAGYRRMISDDIRLSRAMAAAVDRHPELQFMTQDLSITTFRYVPDDLRNRLGEDIVENHLDSLNQELLNHMQRGGEAFVSNAVIRGRYALRACIVNFHTGAADVVAVPEIAVRLGRTLDARLRPHTLRG